MSIMKTRLHNHSLYLFLIIVQFVYVFSGAVVHFGPEVLRAHAITGRVHVKFSVKPASWSRYRGLEF